GGQYRFRPVHGWSRQLRYHGLPVNRTRAAALRRPVYTEGMFRTVLGLLLAAPIFAQPASSGIQAFFAQAFEEQLHDTPEFATSVGHHEYDDRWTDWSKTGREQRKAHLQQRLQKIQSFPQAALSPQDRLSARLMEYDTTLRLDAFDLEDELFAVMQQ